MELFNRRIILSTEFRFNLKKENKQFLFGLFFDENEIRDKIILRNARRFQRDISKYKAVCMYIYVKRNNENPNDCTIRITFYLYMYTKIQPLAEFNQQMKRDTINVS